MAEKSFRPSLTCADEAHRLHRYINIAYRGAYIKAAERIGLAPEKDELDWILHQCRQSVLFYDEGQVVGPSGISESLLKEKIEEDRERRGVKYHALVSQMRVKGGVDYVKYVRELLSGTAAEKKRFPSYEFKLVSHFRKFQELMLQKEEETGLSRMAAGYAWPWKSKKDKSEYDIEIEGIKIRWNHCTEDWIHSPEAISEVGCIHSVQGYDLNYGFIIMGNDIGYDSEHNSIIIRRKNYFDRSGKNTASDDRLAEYIKNIYYVLMTRGILGTYLYVCDPDLREYMSRYMDCEEDE